MIIEPRFWRTTTPAARALSLSLAPAAALYDLALRLRERRTRPTRPPVPVMCVGAATLGGVGKTPFALMSAPLLATAGFQGAFLTRGYGGALKGPLRVDPAVHGAADVGDEALLLAGVAPTFVARDRPAGARMASETGVGFVIMDDGFQNPSIEKAFSVLLVDAADPEGNGRTFPAGPLREPLRDALARADAVVSVGVDRATPAPPAARAHFRSWLETPADGGGARVVAFCGIGAPQRFFDSLERAGYAVARTESFPDHHAFTSRDLARLRKAAADASARLITTMKDFVRLAPHERQGVSTLPVVMRIDAPERFVAAALGAFGRFTRAAPERA